MIMMVIAFIKRYFVIFVCILLALLFMYAGASKLFDFEAFQVQLAQSPLLSAYAGIISYGIISIELIVAFTLCFGYTRRIALYTSLGLMAAFTIYIYLILNYSEFVPCNCGGILEKLGWEEHFIFNICFLILAAIGIFILEKQREIKVINILLCEATTVFISCIAVIGLFTGSEHIIKEENNFTRRFLQHPVMEDLSIDLRVNSYYFAGITDGILYLGNLTAPLLITTVDTNLNNFAQTKIEVDNKKYPFKSVQLQVKQPYFYLHDGSVPVIFRGKLKNSLANTISYGDAYFNQMTVLDSMRFALRTQRSNDNEYTMALLNLGQEKKLALKPTILEKQIDGVFDVDGLLASEPTSGRIVYTYFYRNQYLVMDSNLNVLNRFNTIDTTHTAKISVTKLSNGKTKMNAPPFSVNKGFALYGDLLFNRSNLKGKYEPAESWKSSAIIDVYRTDMQQYIGSFYIRDKDGKRMSSMVIGDRYLYVLVGNKLQRYKIRDGAFK